MTAIEKKKFCVAKLTSLQPLFYDFFHYIFISIIMDLIKLYKQLDKRPPGFTKFDEDAEGNPIVYPGYMKPVLD